MTRSDKGFWAAIIGGLVFLTYSLFRAVEPEIKFLLTILLLCWLLLIGFVIICIKEYNDNNGGGDDE